MSEHCHDSPTRNCHAADDDYNPEADVIALRAAMKGCGTDELAIIDVLSVLTNAQRLRLAADFKTAYGKDLIKDLKSELGGHFEDIVVAMFQPNSDFDAKSLRDAMKGAGTDESTLIDILCTRTNAEIKEVIASYKRLYDRSLEKDVASDTSGYFERILISLLQANRHELTSEEWALAMEEGWEAVIDQDLARSDAKKLYEAGEAQWGTDESEFNKVLASRQFFQLRATFDEYGKISGRSILDAISSEISGDTKKGYKAIVSCAMNPPQYFAERLGDAIRGLGTNDDLLVRIIISRAEIDLRRIAHFYHRLYDESLVDAIEGDCSGDYKRMLVALVNNSRRR